MRSYTVAGTLSLSSTVEVFPCPNCRETINTSTTQCRFCAALIDHTAAIASAAVTTKINQAFYKGCVSVDF
jgi:hypothetical protein